MGFSAIRGRLLSFVRAPVGAGDRESYRYLEDGVALIADGRVVAVGPADEIEKMTPAGVAMDHYPDGLILPGFIDLHIHLPQVQMIASYGAQLMDWLERYVFPQEAKFADPAHAAANAKFLLDELFRNGTTTAVAYGSVHPESVDALFAEAQGRGACMIAGKVMMDRNGPTAVLDTAQSSYDDGKALIRRWHGRGRLAYAVTPRFAVTSTEAQLAAAGALMAEHDGLYLQTHISENRGEIEAARSLFPQARNYLDIYDRYGLLGPRALFGHCIHLDDDEIDRMAESGSVAVFCPTSNLFLGSGLFDRARLTNRTRKVTIGMATDVGGGTSYSMLRTAAEGYKILQLQGQNLSALEAMHMITRGAAAALGLDSDIGAIEPGRFADLVVLDSRATPAMAHRMAANDGDLEDELFALMTMGDDRSVKATYIQGRQLHERQSDERRVHRREEAA